MKRRWDEQAGCMEEGVCTAVLCGRCIMFESGTQVYFGSNQDKHYFIIIHEQRRYFSVCCQKRHPQSLYRSLKTKVDHNVAYHTYLPLCMMQLTT